MIIFTVKLLFEDLTSDDVLRLLVAVVLIAHHPPGRPARPQTEAVLQLASPHCPVQPGNDKIRLELSHWSWSVNTVL